MSESKILTSVTLIVPVEREAEFLSGYQELLASGPRPQGFLRSELLRHQDGRWLIQTLWLDRASIMAARRSGVRPAALDLAERLGAAAGREVAPHRGVGVQDVQLAAERLGAQLLSSLCSIVKMSWVCWHRDLDQTRGWLRAAGESWSADGLGYWVVRLRGGASSDASARLVDLAPRRARTTATPTRWRCGLSTPTAPGLAVLDELVRRP